MKTFTVELVRRVPEYVRLHIGAVDMVDAMRRAVELASSDQHVWTLDLDCPRAVSVTGAWEEGSRVAEAMKKAAP